MKKLLVIGAAGAFMLAGAGCAKFTEPFKDAHVSNRNTGPATVGTMPDGFNNWAAKCDGTTRVYTLYHNDAKYGGIAVSPNDPQCGGAR